MQEALEGLPGVRILKVDLGDDRFDLEYDPTKSTSATVLQVVSELGYQPEVLRDEDVGSAQAQEAGPSTPAPLDLASMSPAIEAARREAAGSGRGILIEFSGKG